MENNNKIQESYNSTISTIDKLIAISKRDNRDYSQLLKDKEKAKKMYRDYLNE